MNNLTLITLDFETFYGTGYTLRAMSTTDYVHDPRFLIHMVGIKIGDGPTRVYHKDDVEPAIRAVDWSRSALLCHNTHFDGYILYFRYGIHPAMYLDTLSMARGVHAHHLDFDLDSLAKLHRREGKLGKDSLVDSKNIRELPDDLRSRMEVYCAQDVNLTYDIYQDLAEVLPERELKVIDIVIRMACWPVLRVNVARLQKHRREVIEAQSRAVERGGVDEDILVSNDKFAEALRSVGCEPPMKLSPRTGLMTYAFAKGDMGFQALKEHPDQQVRDLYAARVVCKSSIERTRVDRFLDATHNGRLPLPIFLNYGGAHTLRMTGGNRMNMQNLTREGELRRSIYVDEDEVIVVVDLSQIEARITAWLAELTEQLAAFAAGKDVYKVMATKIYGIPISEVDKLQRFVAKCAVLGLGFQMGGIRFQGVLETGALGPPVFMELDDCKNIVASYRASNPGLGILWNLMGHVLFCMKEGIDGSYKCLSWGKGHVRLPNGQKLYYPGLQGLTNSMPLRHNRWYTPTLEDTSYIGREGRTKIFPGALLENIVQALARIVVTDAMVTIDEKGLMDIASMTHDEIIGVTSKNSAPRVYKQVLKIITAPLPWAPGLPLAAEGGYARNYSK